MSEDTKLILMQARAGVARAVRTGGPEERRLARIELAMARIEDLEAQISAERAEIERMTRCCQDSNTCDHLWCDECRTWANDTGCGPACGHQNTCR